MIEPEPWGEDPKLVELLGAPGAAGFRALFDGFPDLVGLLWAVRDANGRIVENRDSSNLAELLAQLGILPTAPSQPA